MLQGLVAETCHILCTSTALAIYLFNFESCILDKVITRLVAALVLVATSVLTLTCTQDTRYHDSRGSFVIIDVSPDENYRMPIRRMKHVLALYYAFSLRCSHRFTVIQPCTSLQANLWSVSRTGSKFHGRKYDTP